MALTTIPSGMIAPAQTFSLNGVTFPATQVPSSNANTLDDYEEGTWTPTWNGGTITSATRCQYVKIGAQVTVTGDLAFGTPSGSAAVTIGGMPFNTGGSSSNQAVGCVMENFCGLGGNSYVTPYFYGADGNLNFYMSNSGGGWVTQTNNQLSSSSRIIFTITYFVGF